MTHLINVMLERYYKFEKSNHFAPFGMYSGVVFASLILEAWDLTVKTVDVSVFKEFILLSHVSKVSFQNQRDWLFPKNKQWQRNN